MQFYIRIRWWQKCYWHVSQCVVDNKLHTLNPLSSLNPNPPEGQGMWQGSNTETPEFQSGELFRDSYLSRDWSQKIAIPPAYTYKRYKMYIRVYIIFIKVRSRVKI